MTCVGKPVLMSCVIFFSTIPAQMRNPSKEGDGLGALPMWAQTEWGHRAVFVTVSGGAIRIMRAGREARLALQLNATG